MAESRSPMDRVFDAIVPRAVDAIDPDELLARIDLDHLLARTDLDAVLARLDIDALIDRVDLDRVLARLDLNALLDHLDLDAIVGKIDIDGIVSKVDIDGIVSKVDIDGIVSKVDIDGIVSKVDIDGIIGKVDLNRVMGQVDMNALLAGVDLKPIMADAGIDELVANTASGIAGRSLDLARSKIHRTDAVLYRGLDRVFRRRDRPVPGAAVGDGPRPGGLLARLLGLLVDSVTVSATFSVGVFLVGTLLELFTGRNFDTAENGGPIWGVAYVGWWGIYLWATLGLVGRTFGKMLLGLRVTDVAGAPLGLRRAAVRTIVFPFSFVLGLGFVPVLFNGERRALHDLAAGSREIVEL